MNAASTRLKGSDYADLFDLGERSATQPKKIAAAPRKFVIAP
jgi:hypothetical protein